MESDIPYWRGADLHGYGPIWPPPINNQPIVEPEPIIEMPNQEPTTEQLHDAFVFMNHQINHNSELYGVIDHYPYPLNMTDLYSESDTDSIDEIRELIDNQEVANLLNTSFYETQPNQETRTTPEFMSELERKLKCTIMETPTGIRERKANCCSVCYNSFEENRNCMTLPCPCSIIAHPECLKRWLTEEKNICPCCRTVIEEGPTAIYDGVARKVITMLKGTGSEFEELSECLIIAFDEHRFLLELTLPIFSDSQCIKDLFLVAGYEDIDQVYIHLPDNEIAKTKNKLMQKALNRARSDVIQKETITKVNKFAGLLRELTLDSPE